MSNLSKESNRQALEKRRILRDYYSSQFSALFHNSVKVNNLPHELPKRYLLDRLYNDGAIAYDKQTGLYLPFNAVGVNQYGLPTRYNLIKYNGGTLQRNVDEVVVLRTNDICLSIKSQVNVIVDKLVEFDMAISQNLEAVKTMTLVEVENNATLLSLDNYNNSRRIGASVCFVSRGTGANLKDAISVTDTGATYLVDKMQEDRRHILNEGLSLIGIATANTEKRERVQSIEVLASQNYAIDMVQMMIDTFNYDAEFGGNPLRLEGNTTLVKTREIELKNMENGDKDGKVSNKSVE